MPKNVYIQKLFVYKLKEISTHQTWQTWLSSNSLYSWHWLSNSI